MFTLTPNLKAVAAVASTDLTRYMLNGVHIDTSDPGGVVRLVATNGHALLVVDHRPVDDEKGLPGIPGFDPGQNGPTSATVPTEAYLQAFKSRPKAGKSQTFLNVVRGTITEALTTFASTNLDIHSVMPVKNIEKAYPDYKQVIPTEAPELEVVFDARLLAKALNAVADIITDSPKGYAPCTLKFTTKHSPVKIEAATDSDNVVAVVMPSKLK